MALYAIPRRRWVERPFPGVPTRIDPGSALARGLTFAYLPLNYSLREPNLVTGVVSAPGTTNPTFHYLPRVGLGWESVSTDVNQGINTLATLGLIRGLSAFTVMVHGRNVITPADGVRAPYLFEPVADNGFTRLGLEIARNTGAVVGTKVNVVFRTGTSAGTARFVNAGAGGTTLISGDVFVMHFTFDSVADLYTLYLNGVQEAQLSVAESAIADTSPFFTPRLLGNTGAAPSGVVFRANVWNRVLSLGEMWQTVDPQTRWDLYWQPSRTVYFDLAATGKPWHYYAQQMSA